MNRGGVYDALIIGGGITGLYAAYRLVVEAGASVVLLERSARLGGRIQTIYHADGSQYEAGAGRFAGHHHRLMHLLDHFGLHRYRVGRRVDYRARGATPQDAGELIRPLLARVLAAGKRMDPALLREQSFGDLCNTVLGPEESRLLRAAFGYNGEFEAINAWDGCRMMRDQRPSVSYYTCREGLSALIARMERALIDSGRCRIYRETTADSFDFRPRSRNFLVRARDRTGGERAYRSRIVLAALPQKELLALGKDVFQESHRALLGSVEPISLHRIYGVWHGPSAGWLEGVPKTTTDGPLRMFIPIQYQPPNSLAMLSYADRSDADHWKRIEEEQGPKQLEKALLEELGVVFPELPAQVPPPSWIRSYYWSEGVHYWRTHVDSTRVSPQVQRLLGPHIPFFVAGEAFSYGQGWIEGALESLDTVFPQMVATYKEGGRRS